MNSTNKEETKAKELKSFSLGGGLLLSALAGFFYYKEKIEIAYVFAALGLAFLFIRLINFKWITPVHTAWMKFAHILGVVNTRIILFIVFILTVVPISLLLKIFRKDILDKNLQKEAVTYWNDRPKKELNIKHYERHF
ncbi:MAG TPA: SxtJ family membrane protein [Leptospiraceae bacterium]|nr:SxtJ family membrane protein [Leptospiraceae bacterium]HMW07155.1 SxtJ family membrane protein [Leptospiraceae bacterium]HMX34588.1 SxtJ family membrane protein [Leptospiraceae bacterium]HMY32771.1 SxtJ family membrane protein [Leptospiraceae bacterium]HMZ65016.1 SxtJ family membrane protein [Leptospiraceae bacterium]